MPLNRLLAVTHAASITGAPMNLAHLLRWIRENSEIEVHTLVLEDGPLLPRFEACGDVTVLDRKTSARMLGLLERGFNRMGASQAERATAWARSTPQLRHLEGFDLAYLNSATSIKVARHLPPVGRLVHHIHELEVAIRTMETPALDALCSVPDAWIAASDPVRHLLVDELGLPAERVWLHEEFIAAEELAARKVSLRQIEECRRQLPLLPTSAAIVLGCGTLDWRKGPDLFIQLACEVRRRTRRPVHFVWLGGEHKHTDWERVRSDRDRAGARHVHFVETVRDPVPWMMAADVFALTSREDPLPLVCLESAVVGTPIVTYRNGGIPGLLERSGPEAASGVVDHLDVAAMAVRVLALLHSTALRETAARQVQYQVRTHHDVSQAAPRLLAELRAIADAPAAHPAAASA